MVFSSMQFASGSRTTRRKAWARERKGDVSRREGMGFCVYRKGIELVSGWVQSEIGGR